MTDSTFIPEGAADSTFIPESDEEKLQREHGDVGSQIQTFGEGLANTATFGLAGHVLNALGADPEARKAREEANPWAHGLGVTAGLLAPIGAPALIGKAGHIAGEAVGALLPEATSVLGKAAVGAAKGIGTGAVEGGLLAGSGIVEEASLGDPNLNAESIAEKLGVGMLLGGGVAGTIGALGGLSKGIATSELGQKFKEWLPEFEGQQILKSTGAVPSEIKKLGARIGEENATKLAREAQELGIATPFTTPAKMAERADEVMGAAHQEQQAALNAAEAAGATGRPMGEIAGRIREDVLRPLEENPSRQGVATAVSNWLNRFEEEFPNLNEGPSLNRLHEMRKGMDAEIKGLRGAYDPDSSYLKNAFHKMRSVFADEINTGIEDAGLDSAAWKAANRKYRVAATIGDLAERGAERQHTNSLLHLTSTLSGLAGFAMHGLPGGFALGAASEAAKRFGPGVLALGARKLRTSIEEGAPATLLAAMPERVATLSEIDATQHAVGDKLEELVEKVFHGAEKAGTVGHVLGEDLIPKIRQLAQNPEAMQQALIAHASDMQEHAPDTAQALQVHRARQIAFLASKLPETTPTGPLGPQLKPSQDAQWRFGKYYEAVNKPSSILEHAASGTLTPLHIEALKETSPALYQRMAQLAMERAAIHQGTIPYRTKLMLSLLSGSDLDGTMSPAAIQANQMAYARPSQKDPAPAPTGKPKSTQTGLSKVKSANRLMTPSQGAEVRLGGT